MLALFGFLVPLTFTSEPPRGSAAATLIVGAAGDPLVVRDESGRTRGGVEKTLGGALGLQLRLGRHVEALGLVAGETRESTMVELDHEADARLGARVTPYGGALSVRALVSPSSGEADYDLAVRQDLGRLLVVAISGGYRSRDRAEVYQAVWDDAVTWSGGAEVRLLYGTSAVAELRGEVGLEEGSGAPAEWLTGLRWAAGDLGLGLYGGTGIGEDMGAPSWRVQAAVTYAPTRPPARRAHETVTQGDVDVDVELDPERDEDVFGPELLDADTPNIRVVDREIVLGQAVFFVTNRKRVRTAFRRVLVELAAFLEAHPELARIEVEGHADATGRPEWNQTLSLMRAEEVCRYLISRGVAPTRLQPVPFGASRPWEDNATAGGRAMNRRVVFTVVEVAP